MTAPRFVQQQKKRKGPRRVFDEINDAGNQSADYADQEEAMNRQQSEESRGRFFHDNYDKPGGIAGAIAALLAQKDNWPPLGDIGRPDDMHPEHTAALSHVSPRDRIEQYGTQHAAHDFDSLDRLAAKLRVVRQRGY